MRLRRSSAAASIALGRNRLYCGSAVTGSRTCPREQRGSTALLRRLAWYGQRIRQQLNPGIVLRVLLTLLRRGRARCADRHVARAHGQPRRLRFVFLLGAHVACWAMATRASHLARGRSCYVVLIVTGVIMLGLVTGAIIAVIIDFLLKEGQGLGAAGFRDHIVICGWNPTARDLIDELRSDDYKRRSSCSSHDADATRRAKASTSSAATRPMHDGPRAGRHRGGRGRTRLPGRSRPTRPTCARS